MPGDEKAQSLSEPGLASDAVAVQVPLSLPDDPNDPEKPYFLMGDAAHPVSLWRWTSGAKSKPQGVGLMNAEGMGKVSERKPEEAGLRAKGTHANGTWRVVMTRSLKTKDAAKDIQIREGRFIPIAFSAWDGSNAEKGSKRTLSTWYWLQLEAPAGSGPILWAIFIALIIAAAEIWWQWSVNRRRHGDQA
jgi:DMSO reductase family type II enzyme heme b subunit